ncbi:multidrug resistance operon repressor [Anaerotignum neopropionicum]|uniref:Multidrug resistance operon repressor n=1 Tax=Anaerotignum neopropionicum TaxID=36847 RepID=A0A136WCF8_9FIRM|nr:MarR family transcriptional regulator [Anaerotignum neopropionicum]KXL52197.1 multidrug resistance operon repressor [Anaerotignum neopropionicum]
MEKLQKLVINDFIQMIERIANGKTNLLDFGLEGMQFYRGEIHMIKMIGDHPGIFISEMARNFNVTRAVVAKTVRKLEEHGFLEKKEDDEDKKRFCLFLTAKGEMAYKLHNQYHQEYDRPLFAYLESLNDNELHIIQEFLKHANALIENHF